MNTIKKILLSTTLLSVLFATVFAPLTHAQDTRGRGQWWDPTLDQFLDKVNDASPNEIFGERYTYAQVSWIIHSIYNILAGPVSACANEPTANIMSCLDDALNAGNTGVVIPLAYGVDILQTSKPASGIDYVAGKLEKFNLIDTSYAQTAEPTAAQAGFGFAKSLGIIQPLWTGVRDAAYSLVIFAILILAFMVMLRSKISAQASITVQSALPRVALGLVMITFSYAIAGFMVDMVFVLQGLMAGVLAGSSVLSEASALEIFTAMNEFGWSAVSFCLIMLLTLLPRIAAIGVGGLAAAAVSGPLAIAALAAIIIVLIVLVVMLIVVLFRIFWLQLKTFTTILMLVIASPLLMLVGIVKGGTISNWIKNIAGQLTVFLAISVMIMLAHLILISTSQDWIIAAGADDVFGLNKFGIKDGVLAGRDVGHFPTGFGYGDVGLLGFFISTGIFMSIPSMAASARDYVLHGKGNFGFDSFGTATGGAAGYGKQAFNAYDAPASAQRAAATSSAGKVMANPGKFTPTQVAGAQKRLRAAALEGFIKSKI